MTATGMPAKGISTAEVTAPDGTASAGAAPDGTATGLTASGPLTVLSEYRWPEEPARELPVLPGYVLSSFSPLVAQAAEGCLAAYYADPSADSQADPPVDPPGDPQARVSRERTGVLLVTAGNDLVSADHVHDKVASGRRLGPLFFFQVAPNSVVGQLTARWGLGGPVVCLSPVGDPLADGLAEAELLLDDGDAEAVLVILAEQADPAVPDSIDHAHALLLCRERTE